MSEFRILERSQRVQPKRRFGWVSETAGPESGLLVEFQSRSGPWVGEFATGGWTGHSSVLPFVDGRRVVVLASGLAYLVDPERMTVDAELSDVAVEAYLARDLDLLVINWHGIVFEGHDARGLRWRTRRVSWDGMENVSVKGKRLTADTWSAPLQEWIPVSVDLVTGSASGGAYQESDAIEDEQLHIPE